MKSNVAVAVALMGLLAAGLGRVTSSAEKISAASPASGARERFLSFRWDFYRGSSRVEPGITAPASESALGKPASAVDRQSLVISVTGVRGGHSGLEIARNGSAIGPLLQVLSQVEGLRLISFKTSNELGNAIPRDVRAVVSLPPRAVSNVRSLAGATAAHAAATGLYGDIAISVEEAPSGEYGAPLDQQSTSRVFALLMGLPAGVQGVDEHGVRTSANVAVVRLPADANSLDVLVTSRSSDDTLLDWQTRRVTGLVHGLSGEVRHEGRYAGWTPRVTRLHTRAQEKFKQLHPGMELQLRSVHAGLEVAEFSRRFPAIHMIAIGAKIENIHTMEERLALDSLGDLYGLIAEILQPDGHGTIDTYYAERGKQAAELFLSELCPIPRESDLPGPILEFLDDFAREHHISFERDRADNALLRAPATCELGHRRPVVLQAHGDMVVAGPRAEEVRRHGVKPIISNGMVTADGSTLGADNGAGLAVALTIATDARLCRPPLWLLVTTREEKGLEGARDLGHDLSNAEALINLDADTITIADIGSAGGISHLITMPVFRTSSGSAN